MPFNIGILERAGIKRGTIHGYALDRLPDFAIKYMRENPQFKEIDSDETVEFLLQLKMNELKINGKKAKFYYCPFTKKPATKKEIKENFNRTEFHCFHCEKKIHPFMNEFHYSNFVCSECKTEDDLKVHKSEFVKYTEEFRKKVKKELSSKRRKLVNYMKKNINI